MTRISLTTLGCKANQADTTMIADGLPTVALEVVPPREPADICVINTCTVTHTADADARQLIRKLRRTSPDARIVVTGCYAQVGRDELTAMPEVDHVVGNADKGGLPGLLRSLAGAPEPPHPRRREWAASLRGTEQIRRLPEGRSRPFDKVQDGCDYVCSFCIIPTARGRSRSVPFHEVLDTVRRYGELGAREIVLTGIHVGHFGRDLRPRRTLLDLLRAIDDQRLVPRVRVSSIEPNEVRAGIIDLAAEGGALCPHFHVPLQSGSDAVLKRMRRVYTAGFYAALMERLRRRLPLAAIGIDVIVGYPGETREEFQETYRLLRSIDFTYLHVFPYSERAGTTSAGVRGAVAPEEKKERSELLRALSEERRHAFHRRHVGRVDDVLVEGRRGRRGRLRGFTPAYVPVELDGPDALRDRLVRAKLVSAAGDGEHLVGEVHEQAGQGMDQ